MSDNCQVDAVGGVSSFREAVCIHTKKICDSCIDKDCIEDLRVFLTQDSQAILEQATTVRARSAELLHAVIDVEPVQFNSGHFTVDITYYYRILVDAVVCAARPCTLCGLAIFSKRVILCGGEGCAKIFTSKTICNGFDQQLMMKTNVPEAVVEVVDPMILASKVVDVCNCGCNDCSCVDLPQAICGCFDGDLVTCGESRRLFVTIGQFSIIRLERDTQLRIPAFSYCLPTKDCSATAGASEESPCDLFSQIQFPINSFFPPCGENECGSVGGTSTGSCACGSVGGTSTNGCTSCGTVAGATTNSCACGSVAGTTTNGCKVCR